MDFVTLLISKLKSKKGSHSPKRSLRIQERMTCENIASENTETNENKINRQTGLVLENENVEAKNKLRNKNNAAKRDFTVVDSTEKFNKDIPVVRNVDVTENEKKGLTNEKDIAPNLVTVTPNDDSKEIDQHKTPNKTDEKLQHTKVVQKSYNEHALYEQFNITIEESDLSNSNSIINLDSSDENVNDIVNTIDNINAEYTTNINNIKSGNLNINEVNADVDIDNKSIENLTFDVDPQEWLDFDEFDKIVKELNSVNPLDVFDIEDVLEKHTVMKSNPNNNGSHNKPNFKITCAIGEEDINSTKSMNNNTNKVEGNDVISISSDEDDLKLGLSLDDLDTLSISFSSIEAFGEDEISSDKCGMDDIDNKTDSKNCIEEKQSKVKDESLTIQNISTENDGKDTLPDVFEQNQTNTEIKINDQNESKTEISQQLSVAITVKNQSNEIIVSPAKEIDNDVIEIKSLPSIENEAEITNVDDKISKCDPDIDLPLSSVKRDDTKTDENVKEIDSISLSSLCSDYHSSDFEFITEDEAMNDGIIINYYRKKNKAEDKEMSSSSCKIVEVTSDSGFNCSNSSQNSDIVHNFDMPGSSRQDVPWNNNNSSCFVVDYNYRQNHEIPQGQQYMDLFQGYYPPTAPYMFENKSMTNSLPDARYEGLGFDMRMLPRPHEDDVSDECKNDANESAKKILQMYPGENKKRRRRF